MPKLLLEESTIVTHDRLWASLIKIIFYPTLLGCPRMLGEGEKWAILKKE